MKMFGSAASASGTPPTPPVRVDRSSDPPSTDRPMSWPIAHQQQLRDVVHRKRQADHAVAPIVAAVRQRRHHRRRDRQPVRRRVHLLLGQIQLARTDVLVGVELDLLEADDARDDVDFAVRLAGTRGRGSKPDADCVLVSGFSRTADPRSRTSRES